MQGTRVAHHFSFLGRFWHDLRDLASSPPSKHRQTCVFRNWEVAATLGIDEPQQIPNLLGAHTLKVCATCH